MTSARMSGIQACVFDAYGTLFDVHSAVGRLRARLGDSQQRFAERLGTRQQTVSEWERGQSRPRRMAQRLLTMLAEADPRGFPGMLIQPFPMNRSSRSPVSWCLRSTVSTSADSAWISARQLRCACSSPTA